MMGTSIVPCDSVVVRVFLLVKFRYLYFCSILRIRTLSTTAPYEVIVGIKASASIPGVFETTVPSAGVGAHQVFGDGGVKQGANILGGIARCVESGVDPQDIVVDVVLCDGSEIQPVWSDIFKTTISSSTFPFYDVGV